MDYTLKSADFAQCQTKFLAFEMHQHNNFQKLNLNNKTGFPKKRKHTGEDKGVSVIDRLFISTIIWGRKNVMWRKQQETVDRSVLPILCR